MTGATGGASRAKEPRGALTHVAADGSARMVDVSSHDVTLRRATATGRVVTSAAALIARGAVAKGDVLAVARIAGIMGAKRTSDLIPLCHPIALSSVEVDIDVNPDENTVLIAARVANADRTGVEMEALTAVAVAGLTVIDMVKAADPEAQLVDVRIESKDGGRSGSWTRGQQ